MRIDEKEKKKKKRSVYFSFLKSGGRTFVVAVEAVEVAASY